MSNQDEDNTQVVSAAQVIADHGRPDSAGGEGEAQRPEVDALPADEWMIRTALSFLAGPYTRLQVCQMVHDRKLGPQDEVCQASQYWFYLHEGEEVKKFLGIELPRPTDTGEEKTQTETTQVDVTDPDLPASLSAAIRGALSSPQGGHLDQPSLNSPSQQQDKPSGLERPVLLRIFAIGLALIVVLLAVAIVRSLN